MHISSRAIMTMVNITFGVQNLDTRICAIKQFEPNGGKIMHAIIRIDWSQPSLYLPFADKIMNWLNMRNIVMDMTSK